MSETRTGVQLIADERLEQIEKHGRTVQSDIMQNDNYELCSAACGLLWNPNEDSPMDLIAGMKLWDWNREILGRMDAKPYKERLIIAGAFIAAEIDRLQYVPNPGDMPSRPVDTEKLDRLDKEVDTLLDSETDESLRARADSQLVHSASSKEGDSQTVPKEIVQWIASWISENIPDIPTVQYNPPFPSRRSASRGIAEAMYHKLQEDLRQTTIIHEKTGNALQSQLSSMTKERDEAVLILDGIEEGAEQWKAEYQNLLALIKNTKPWPLGGYAPGNYSCKCCYCEKSFIGDKMAVMCMECSLSGLQVYIEQLTVKGDEANQFIRDIGKLLGEDNLGFDGISWTLEDFENAIKQRNEYFDMANDTQKSANELQNNFNRVIKLWQASRANNRTLFNKAGDLMKERDLYKEQSETYLKAWKESTTLLEGKNLENAQLREVIAVHQKDLEDAAGELLVSLPYPGTEAAKMLRANRLIGYQRDAAREEADQYRKALEDADIALPVTGVNAENQYKKEEQK